MKALRALLLLAAVAGSLSAQRNQVKWALALEPPAAAPGGKVLARLTAAIDPGWHLYSLTKPATPANIATTITLAPNPAIAKHRVLQPAPKRAFDKNFNTETETYDGEAVFLVELELAPDAGAGASEITLEARYQVCSDTQCIPPVRRPSTATLKIDPGARAAAPVIPAGYAEPASGPASQVRAGTPSAAVPAPAPAPAGVPANDDLAPFLLVAFGFGLAAIFTPCVFPMIPITMSFFLNRHSGSRGEAIFQAATFCLGIIVLFSALGLAATAALGPFGVVQIGSNPWVNGFIALIFLAFGLSLLGAFEITLPSSLLTHLDRGSQKGGVAGTLLMGFTFSLTSFACVGPFMGTLLAASVQGGGSRPLLGMASFAAGLSLPFFLLALFPSYLKRLPRSGGWMARVKIVMGFVVLAAMLKYLASVDQVLQWNVLTRERFLAAWVVLFSMAGLYLLGFVRLEGIKADQPMGLGRLLTGMLFLAFSISLIPGMFGGRLGEIDAYVPLASQNSGGASGGEAGLVWMKDQFQEALDRGRAENRPVFVSFTGYACTNCHWMKANMFTRPEIGAAMKNFVLVELYTDGVDDTAARNQNLQESKFQSVAIPFYAIFGPNGSSFLTFCERPPRRRFPRYSGSRISSAGGSGFGERKKGPPL
jgi:thiol:disulfide interchange protein